MPHSSDGLPEEDPPFGADNQIHENWRRSTDGRPAREQDADDHRDYAAFVNSTQASYGARHGARPSIAPSSIHNVPNKLKRLLRRYPILKWVLIGVFQIGVISLIAGIVLAAATSHAKGAGGAKVAVVILIIWGLVLIVGSAAGCGTVWKGRKERAKLEKQWAVEEEIKEKRRTRELAKQEHKRQEIKERKRSLSNGRRSTDRGRSLTGMQDREAMESRPSFQEMTPAQSQHPDDYPPQSPDEYAMKSLPLIPMNPIAGDALGIMGQGPLSSPAVQSHHQTSQADRESTWTHHLDVSEDDDSDSSARARALNAVLMRDNDILMRDNDILMRNIVRTVSQGNAPNLLPASPAIIESTFGIMGSGSTARDPNPTAFDTSTTLLSSAPEHASLSPNAPTSPPPTSPFPDRYFTPPLTYSTRPITASPQIPAPAQPHSSPTHTSSSPLFSNLRSYNGLQGSDQSDENFQAAVDNPSDADSLDSSTRQMTKARSMAAIERWNSGEGVGLREGARSAGAAAVGGGEFGRGVVGGRRRRFTDLVGRRGRWEGERDPGPGSALDGGIDEEVAEESGTEDDRRSEGDVVERVRYFTGLAARRRSRSVGGWDAEGEGGEGEDRLERLRRHLRKSRGASDELAAAEQSWD